MNRIQQSKGYVDPQCLEAAGKLMLPIKERSYELMRLSAGQILLDLGCGPGIDTIAMGQLVGATGQVIGIDIDEDMIAAANGRAEQAGLLSHVSHKHGSANALPYAANYFNACRCERMLMHLNPAEAEQTVVELKRVLVRGGWLVLIEPDWGTLSIATDEVDVERKLARVVAERFLRNGYAGRQLLPLMRRMGFHQISVELVPIWLTDLAPIRYLTNLDRVEALALTESQISPEELERWYSDLEEKDSEGIVFGSLNIAIVAGRKPEMEMTAALREKSDDAARSE